MDKTDNNEANALTPELAQTIESFSLMLEQSGLPRMAGRIFAFLLLSEENDVTQSDLAALLQASTGSVSTMIRLLEQLGFVERVSLPGHRRDRFRIRQDPLVEMSKRRIEGVIHMLNVVERAKHHKEIGPRATARLERAESFYRFFHIEMELALVRWMEAHPVVDDRPVAE